MASGFSRTKRARSRRSEPGYQGNHCVILWWQDGAEVKDDTAFFDARDDRGIERAQPRPEIVGSHRRMGKRDQPCRQ